MRFVDVENENNAEDGVKHTEELLIRTAKRSEQRQRKTQPNKYPNINIFMLVRVH